MNIVQILSGHSEAEMAWLLSFQVCSLNFLADPEGMGGLFYRIEHAGHKNLLQSQTLAVIHRSPHRQRVTSDDIPAIPTLVVR